MNALIFKDLCIVCRFIDLSTKLLNWTNTKILLDLCNLFKSIFNGFFRRPKIFGFLWDNEYCNSCFVLYFLYLLLIIFLDYNRSFQFVQIANKRLTIESKLFVENIVVFWWLSLFLFQLRFYIIIRIHELVLIRMILDLVNKIAPGRHLGEESFVFLFIVELKSQSDILHFTLQRS